MGHSMDLSCSEASVELAEDAVLEAASPSDFVRPVRILDSERRTSFEKRLLATSTLQVGRCACSAHQGQSRMGRAGCRGNAALQMGGCRAVHWKPNAELLMMQERVSTFSCSGDRISCSFSWWSISVLHGSNRQAKSHAGHPGHASCHHDLYTAIITCTLLS